MKKLSSILPKVIELSAAIREYWDRELPKRHPNYPLIDPDADDGPPPPEEKKLRRLLKGLPEDTLFQIGYIAQLGRGDSQRGDLEQMFEYTKQWLDDSDLATEIFVGTPGLSDHLQRGMSQLAERRIDVDHLPVSSVRS